MKEKLSEVITKEMLEKDFTDGLWHKEIAQKYEISLRSVYTLVKEHNIQIDRKNKAKEKEYHTCKHCGKTYLTSKHEGYCGYNCYYVENIRKIDETEFIEATTEQHKKIQELRKQGKTFRQIAKELNCAPSAVAYACSQKVKDDCRKRCENLPEWENRLLKALGNFKHKRPARIKESKNSDWNMRIRSAVSFFKKRAMKNNKNINDNVSYSYKDVIKHIGGTTTKCYLTGRTIDILKDEYHLDHIVPVAKGGTNELSNLGITCPDANMSKSSMTVDEYLALCKEVLEHHGYKVTKE